MQLFQATAAGFELQVPSLGHLDSQACLAQYAQFVQVHAGQRLRDRNEIPSLTKRLYQNAMAMARPLNQWLRLRTQQDVMATACVLYRVMNVDIQGNGQGEVVIRRCYFSAYYSADVCRLMSAMDRGLFAGLSDGGKLTFSARITEGQPCCLAHFCLPGRVAKEPKED